MTVEPRTIKRTPLFLAVPGPCDIACAWCNYLGRPPDASLGGIDEVTQKIELLARGGAREVGFGLNHSEPTTHPAFPDLVRRARSLGFSRVTLSTSGIKLADRAYLRRLKRCGLTNVVVSLAGLEPGLADVLLGRRGATAAKLAALDNCAREGLQTDVNLMFLRPALTGMRQSVEGLRARMAKLKGDVSMIGCLMRVAEEDPRRYALLWPSYGEVAWAMRSVRSAAPKFSLQSSDAPLCVRDRIPGMLLQRTVLPPHSYEKPRWLCAGCGVAADCPGVYAGYFKAHGKGPLLGPQADAAPPPADAGAIAGQLDELRMFPPFAGDDGSKPPPPAERSVGEP